MHRWIISLLAGLMMAFSGGPREGLRPLPEPDPLPSSGLSQEVARARAQAGNAHTELDSLYFNFRLEHGQPWEWKPETWVRFRERFSPAAQRLAKEYPHIESGLIARLALEPYALPEVGVTGFEEAADRAWEAVSARFGLDRAGRVARGLFLDFTPESRIWKIHFYDGKNIEGTPYAQLDALTGAVTETGLWPAAIDLAAAFSGVPDQASAHLALRPVPPRADGKPAFWYGAFAPAYFWEQLDRSPWLDKSLAEWEAAFGKDQIFWPLEIRALEYLSRQPSYQDYWTAMPGLPGPEDIPQEKALAIARAAMEKSPKIAEEVKARLKPDIAYFFCEVSFNGYGNQWYIQFHDPDHPLKEMLYLVVIDADTGDVVLTQDVDEGNG